MCHMCKEPFEIFWWPITLLVACTANSYLQVGALRHLCICTCQQVVKSSLSSVKLLPTDLRPVM